MELDKAAVETQFNMDFDSHFDGALTRLRPLEADGLVSLGQDAITVRLPGRLLVRNIASAFDAYLHDAAPDEQPAYSESV
jgi:Coproporphyrinogen III oxidase and related Fe-S oxidoreductases